MCSSEAELHHPFWVRPVEAQDRLRMGLTEAFLEELGGEVVGLELAAEGAAVGKREALGFLHTAEKTIDLRAPFALTVLARNAAALDDPRLVGASPYDRGWLAEVRRPHE